MSRSQYGRLASLMVALGLVAGCGGDMKPEPEELMCGDLDPLYLADGGVGTDGIPALTDPPFVPLDDEVRTAYLVDESRVIGVEVDGEWLGIPHNVMYRHEIVNLNRGDERFAVTYCPLTGSSLAFDRGLVSGAEFGVSGLLYQANLIMYDRTTDYSLWPQMMGVSGCGPREGQTLVRRPLVETTWLAWKELFPGSRVIGVDASQSLLYSLNPYGEGYEHPDNPDFAGFSLPREDRRRQPKERILGLPASNGQAPMGFPFHAMEEQGDLWVGEFEYAGEAAVVFWDAAAFGAAALRPVADGQTLTFAIDGDAIVDNETGSHWDVAGRATTGPLMGEQLEGISAAYVAFWQPWAAFHPGTTLVIE